MDILAFIQNPWVTFVAALIGVIGGIIGIIVGVQNFRLNHRVLRLENPKPELGFIQKYFTVGPDDQSIFDGYKDDAPVKAKASFVGRVYNEGRPVHCYVDLEMEDGTPEPHQPNIFHLDEKPRNIEKHLQFYFDEIPDREVKVKATVKSTKEDVLLERTMTFNLAEERVKWREKLGNRDEILAERRRKG